MKKPTEHKHSAASNTKEAWSTFIGCTVKGVLHGGLHGHAQDTTTTLVFECGYGLTFCSTGAHWITQPDDVARAIRSKRDELNSRTRELQDVLALAGAT